MGRIAKALAGYVINKGKVGEADREVYEYGFLIAMELGLGVVSSLCIVGMLHMPVEGLLFFAVFIPLRSYAGGLHLDKYWSCFGLSCLTLLAVLLVVKFVHVSAYVLLPFLFLLVLAVYCLYPVENANRPVDDEEDRHFRRKLKRFLCLDCIIAVACAAFQKEGYLLLMAGTFSMVVATMAIGKLKHGKESAYEISCINKEK